MKLTCQMINDRIVCLFSRTIDSIKVRPSIEKDVEQLMHELVDRIVKQEETLSNNALSLLQSFVIEKTPNSLPMKSADMNNNHFPDDDDDDDDADDDDDSIEEFSETTSSLFSQPDPVVEKNPSEKSNENPLVSLEKMLAYPTTSMESLSSAMIGHGLRSTYPNQTSMNVKKKKFDKYRLFAEKMLRSTLS